MQGVEALCLHTAFWPSAQTRCAAQPRSRLAPYSLPTPSISNTSAGTGPACRPYSLAFAEGHCLLTISFDQMRATPAPAVASVPVGPPWRARMSRGALPPDALGVAPLPGSETILDRSTGSLVACKRCKVSGSWWDKQEPGCCPNAVDTTCAAQVRGAVRSCVRGCADPEQCLHAARVPHCQWSLLHAMGQCAATPHVQLVFLWCAHAG